MEKEMEKEIEKGTEKGTEKGMEKAIKRIHFCGGDKGGVGKTFFCKILIDYYENLDIPITIYDLDKTNKDIYNSGSYHNLKRNRRKIKIKGSYFSDNPELMDKADEIIYALLEGKHDVIVNLPAGSSAQMERWWERNNCAELIPAQGCMACHWILLNGENFDRAERSILKALMDIVLVRNLYLRSNWDTINDLMEKQLQNIKNSLQEEYKLRIVENIKIINLESLSKSVSDILSLKKLLIKDSYQTSDLKLLDRQKLISFTKTMYKILEKTGKLPVIDSDISQKSFSNYQDEDEFENNQDEDEFENTEDIEIENEYKDMEDIEKEELQNTNEN